MLCALQSSGEKKRLLSVLAMHLTIVCLFICSYFILAAMVSHNALRRCLDFCGVPVRMNLIVSNRRPSAKWLKQ